MPDRLDNLIAKAETLHAADGVAIVLVKKNGKCFPDKLIAKAGKHVILWVTNGDDLTINPIAGLKITNNGVFSHASPTAPMSETKYTGTVTTDGDPTPFDPRLEVVP